MVGPHCGSQNGLVFLWLTGKEREEAKLHFLTALPSPYLLAGREAKLVCVAGQDCVVPKSKYKVDD